MIGRNIQTYTCLALILAVSLPVTKIYAAPLSTPSLKAIPEADKIAPHKALYDISLLSAKNGSRIINIHGKMLFEWKPSCEGWITNHRFTLTYDYADNPAMTVSSDFSTFESFDGKHIDFISRRKKDGEVYEELRGKADMPQKGSVGLARFSVPDALTFNLASGTLFPTGHTAALLGKAKDGTRFFQSTVFDGSDDKGPVDVNSFIGRHFAKDERSLPVRDVAKALDSKLDPALLLPGWNVRMAFFPSSEDEEVADYELTMAFQENGIVRDMVIEYGDFSVQQKLVALEKVAPDSCKN